MPVILDTVATTIFHSKFALISLLGPFFLGFTICQLLRDAYFARRDYLPYAATFRRRFLAIFSAPDISMMTLQIDGEIFPAGRPR